ARCSRTDVIRLSRSYRVMAEPCPPLQNDLSVVAFHRARFAHRCSRQTHAKLSVTRQPEFVECDFIAKCVDQSAVVQELRCSERPPRSFFRFDEAATFSASSCERS